MKGYGLLLLLSGCIGPVARAQVLVIANPGVKTAAISHSALRDVFLGASSSLQDGTRVTPVLLRESTVHEDFLTLYVGRSDAAFRASWRSLLFSGQASLPRSFESEPELVAYVARTPGAVGYIGRTTPHDGVKVLTVR